MANKKGTWAVYKKYKQGVKVVNTEGEIRTLLTPAGKGAKYAAELRNNERYTNDFQDKLDKNGDPMSLSKSQKAYRAGYLDARKDNANAYKANKKKQAGRSQPQVLLLPAPQKKTTSRQKKA